MPRAHGRFQRVRVAADATSGRVLSRFFSKMANPGSWDLWPLNSDVSLHTQAVRNADVERPPTAKSVPV